MEPRFLLPGESPTAADYNALLAVVQSLLRPSSAGNIEYVTTSFGPAAFDYNLQPRQARITADRTDNLYGWVDVVPADDGAVDDFPDGGDGTSGTDESAPAIELNGRTDVAEGTVVTLFPSPFGNFLTFVAPGGAGGTPKPTVIHVECDVDGNMVEYVGLRYGPAVSVAGKVVDSSGVPVSGVTVTLRAAGGGATVATTTTNVYGQYGFNLAGTVSGDNEVTAGGSYTPSATTVSWSGSTADVVADFEGV